jgi:threonine-phosphate decarboxylase
LGYITATPAVISRLRDIRHPWSINSVAITAGLYLLKHGRSSIPNLDAYLKEAERLRTALKGINGIRMFESKSTFMLGYLEDMTSSQLKQYLLQQHGILIRDCSDFEGLTNNFFRVTAQLPEENDQLISAIREFMD